MEEYEKSIWEFLEERAWTNLRPGDVAKSICIEAAELLEIFQWSNPALPDVLSDNQLMELTKSELADVLNYCVELAVLLGLNTEQIMRDKLDKVRKKYPAELMKSSRDGEPRTDNVYWTIKRRHRGT